MKPLKTSVMIYFFFITNSALAQNVVTDTTAKEQNLKEIYVRSKVDLLQLLLKFASKNFTENLPDSTFRYNFQFSISTQINESAQTTDSASGCFYVDSKKGKYKWLSSLRFGDFETSGLNTTAKTTWGFKLTRCVF